MKAKWLDRALFISSHFYVLCTTEKQYKRVLKDLDIPKSEWPPFVMNWHSDATAHHFEHQAKGKMATAICIRNFEGKTPGQIAGLMAHEAMHLWREIRLTLGEHEPSSELEAYAMGTLTQQLVDEFYRQTRTTA